MRRDLAAVIAEAIDREALIGDGSRQHARRRDQRARRREPNSARRHGRKFSAFPPPSKATTPTSARSAGRCRRRRSRSLRSTAKVASTDSVMLMEAPDTLAGYPVQVSTLLDGDTTDTSIVIFGAWSQLLVGYWSGVDILVNPYEATAYMRGRVLMRVMRDVDVAVRHGESFAYASMSV